MLAICLALWPRESGLTADGYVYPVLGSDGNYNWPALRVGPSTVASRGQGLFAAVTLPPKTKIPFLGILVHLNDEIKQRLRDLETSRIDAAEKPSMKRREPAEVLASILNSVHDPRSAYASTPGKGTDLLVDPWPGSQSYGLNIAGRANEPDKETKERDNCYYWSHYLITKQTIPAGRELLWCYGVTKREYKTSCRGGSRPPGGKGSRTRTISLERYLQRFHIEDIPKVEKTEEFRKWLQSTTQGKKAWKEYWG